MATSNWYGGARRAGIGAGASGRRLRGGNSGARGSQRKQQQLGRQIEADYYFVRRIGGGSFGDVYLAEERANRSHKVRVVCRAPLLLRCHTCAPALLLLPLPPPLLTLTLTLCCRLLSRP